MSSGRPLAVALFAVLVLAGCGDSGGDSSGDAAKQDAAVKSSARSLATELETCFIDRQTYEGCTGTSGPLGSAPGEVEVSAASAGGYTLTAHSESGVTFKLAKDAGTGATTRSCTPAGKGGCQSDGTW